MGLLTTTTALVVGAGLAPAQAATPAPHPPPASAGTDVSSWTPDLASGEAAGVTARAGTVRLDAGARAAPREGGMPEGGPTGARTRGPAGDPAGGVDPDGAVPTGLLTLAPHDLARPTRTVTSVVDGHLPAGTSASVDVRGRRANGTWTEWVPATATTPRAGSATLAEPTREVQGRLVLTGTDAGAVPSVRAVTLTAAPPAGSEGGPDPTGPTNLTEAAPVTASVFATREGLVGGTTANGHVITERDHFVALPSRRALSPRATSDYSVRVCAPNGRCAFAPVWDVGPWNTRDDYWNPPEKRQEWKDLPQGTPQAQAAFRDGYNGGKDQYGRAVRNPAGIDLADGVFWDALGLTNNAQVRVDYLWTGSLTLAQVRTTAADGLARVRSGPSATASVVGVAANTAAVPVRCMSGDWLQVGEGQYLSAAVLPTATAVAACAAP